MSGSTSIRSGASTTTRKGCSLLTSDGELAALLTHPRHGIEREYEVRVRGVPDEHDLDRLSRGISLEGRRTAPAVVELTKVIDAEKGQQALLSFVIREGRNRQVRNMCDAIGHPVVRLRRRRIGPITDEHIRPGEFRDLTPREVAMLRKPAASAGDSLPPKGGSHADPSGCAFRLQPEETTHAAKRSAGSSRASAASEPPERSGASRRERLRSRRTKSPGLGLQRPRPEPDQAPNLADLRRVVDLGVGDERRRELGHAPAARAQIGGEHL